MSEHHDHSHAVVTEENSKKLMVALGLTTTFLIVEVVAAFITQSLALLSDAAHMFTDVAALAIALAAIKIGKKAADDKRTFGYQRFEILAALFNAVMLFVVAIYIVYEAYQRFTNPAEIQSVEMMIVAVIGLVINLISMKILSASAEGSLNIKGAYLETISKELIDKIDYEDRTFINRQKSYDELSGDLGVEELTESIYYAGLINPIYLQLREDGKYRVLSGYRRSISIKVGYKNYEGYEVEGNAIIIPIDADKSELELISLHENVYREDLKVIELAYKINKDAKESGKTLEELSEDYGMSTRQLK